MFFFHFHLIIQFQKNLKTSRRQCKLKNAKMCFSFVTSFFSFKKTYKTNENHTFWLKHGCGSNHSHFSIKKYGCTLVLEGFLKLKNEVKNENIFLHFSISIVFWMSSGFLKLKNEVANKKCIFAFSNFRCCSKLELAFLMPLVIFLVPNLV